MENVPVGAGNAVDPQFLHDPKYSIPSRTGAHEHHTAGVLSAV